MTDYLVKRLNWLAAVEREPTASALKKAASRIEKLEAALREIKALHHEGGVDDLQDRDDMTYSIVWKALEVKDD